MTRDTDILNARQAAEFLCAHVETVRRLARRGEIPSFKVGKDWRFHKEAIQRWSEDQQPTSHQLTVLIVDDEEGICVAHRRIVKKLGHSSIWATSGAEGLEIIATNPPDLILLDLMMPDMKGPEFLRRLRLSDPEMPVIIVTGFPDSALMTEAATYGPLMLVSKPAGAGQLERAIRMALAG